MKLDKDLRTLAYAIHRSYVEFAQPVETGKERVISIGHPNRNDFGEMAFAWASALPTRAIEFRADPNADPDDPKVLWMVGRSPGSRSQPHLRFSAWPTEAMNAWIDKAERHWRAAPGAADLKSMTAYQQCAAKADKFRADTKEADLAAREAARVSAHAFPPLKGSDEDKALLTAKAGKDFYVNYEVGKLYFATRGKFTTFKPLIAKLRDPDFKLIEFTETASEKGPQGWVKVLAMFGRHMSPRDVSHEYSYYSPPSLTLIEAREFAEAAKKPAGRPKKTLKDRKDVI